MVKFYNIKQTRTMERLIFASKLAPGVNITAESKHCLRIPVSVTAGSGLS
jgi:hypothetical protein